MLACGMTGPGVWPSPSGSPISSLACVCIPRDLEGETVLITAGPTQEPLDPVRFISNRSSGKMGYALATGRRRARSARDSDFRAGAACRAAERAE